MSCGVTAVAVELFRVIHMEWVRDYCSQGSGFERGNGNGSEAMGSDMISSVLFYGLQ